MKKLLFLTLGLGLLIPISSQASTSPCTDGQSCIIKYYSYLNEKNFSKAISLTTGDNKTETAVKTTYKNIERIIPYNIQEGKNSIYTFNIYYKDKGAKESKIFEIKKQYIGNLLKNISSRTLQGVQPAEFSLNDPQNKYEILEQKPISFYTYIEADEN